MAKRGRRRLGKDSHMMAMRMPLELLEKIDAYRERENLPDRTSTIRKILADHLDKCIA